MSRERPAAAACAPEPQSPEAPAGLSPDYALAFDVRLVEEAVLLGVQAMPVARQQAFRQERDRIYEIHDADERESTFGSLHGRWFRELALAAPFHRTLAERASRFRRTAGCRAYLAAGRPEEHADLLVPEAGEPGEGTIVVRLRPASLLDADALMAFLRVEFSHIADMLDPRFGYEPALPASDLGPAIDNLWLTRYRVTWGTTVEGRLDRRGWSTPERAAARRQEFLRTFHWLGDGAEAAFRRWFEEDQPTHAAILACAQDPRGAAKQIAAGGNLPQMRT